VLFIACAYAVGLVKLVILVIQVNQFNQNNQFYRIYIHMREEYMREKKYDVF